MKRNVVYALVVIFIVTMVGVIGAFFFVRPLIDKKLTQIPGKVTAELAFHNGTYVPLAKITINVQHAAIASQDENFYTNPGISLPGTVRALFYTVVSHKRQGASTITEQLAKNVLFQDQDNLKTDIETKILALFITRYYTKKKILEMYLNDIYFGNHAYGISQAAHSYFHTDAAHLNGSESAYLIGLINAPSYLSAHPEQATFEAKLVLEEMLTEHYLSAKDEKKADSQLTQ